MQLSFLLFQKILAMAIMMMMGFTLVKTKLLKSDDSKVVSAVNLYLVCPCMILMAFQLELSAERLKGLAVAFGAAIFLHLFFIVITKFIGDRLHLDVVERASLIYSNGGNLIIPLVGAILGSEYVFYSCAFLAVQTFLHWVHLIRMYQKGTPFQIKKVIFNPNVLAIFVGMVCFFAQFTFPTLVSDVLRPVGDMVGPTAMIMMGMLMADVDLKAVFTNKRYYALMFGRLIVYPMLMILVIYASQITRLMPGIKEVLLVTMLATSASVAVTVTQMANISGADARKASAINVMSIIFCIFTMPIMSAVYMWMC